MNIKLPAIIVMIALVLSACDRDRHVPLRIGTNVWPGYEPLYLARHMGLLNKNRLQLVEYPSATEVMRAFRNNAIDAASLTLDEALLLRQDNIPIKVVLVHDISNGGDVIVARPKIRNMRDLKGMAVAIEASALGSMVISRALQINNMSVADLKIVRADVDAHENLYAKGAVDAVVTFEPVRTKLLKLGAKEIFTSKEIPDEIVDVLVVREEFLKKNTGYIVELVNAWFKALDFMAKDMEKSAEIMSGRLKIGKDEVKASYAGLLMPDRQKNISLLYGDDAGLNKSLKKIHSALVEHRLLHPDVSVDGLLYGGFVKQ